MGLRQAKPQELSEPLHIAPAQEKQPPELRSKQSGDNKPTGQPPNPRT
jgi:hypothetical protein